MCQKIAGRGIGRSPGGDQEGLILSIADSGLRIADSISYSSIWNRKTAIRQSQSAIRNHDMIRSSTTGCSRPLMRRYRRKENNWFISIWVAVVGTR
jgi:hypothetical protein